MIDEDTITNNANSHSKVVSAQKLIQEIEFTDQIQSMLEYGECGKISRSSPTIHQNLRQSVNANPNPTEGANVYNDR